MGLIRGQYIYICTMYIPLINMCVYIYIHMKNMELIISMFFRTILNLNDIPWDNGILSKPWDSAQISARVFFLGRIPSACGHQI